MTTPLSFSEPDFQALPHTSITVTDSAGENTTYSGVDLAALLNKAGVPLEQDLKGADVAKYLHVQGVDGFVAIISLPEFDNGTFLVADAPHCRAGPVLSRSFHFKKVVVAAGSNNSTCCGSSNLHRNSRTSARASHSRPIRAASRITLHA
ncbi:hypothetical protein GGD67_005397 [Bradyrhizobium sp. IAR9]|uniref:hypothetical protein n=1 Tax=Bradyrhizobium sp. IAR9 TaxID=2663841 RepID=UPI0015C95010|nr:hypothetical protein [Bradyrhizobium sp. IAR9]NYG47914.1 hypothetical protein [Bradyrhizobium sp. IAR9]